MFGERRRLWGFLALLALCLAGGAAAVAVAVVGAGREEQRARRELVKARPSVERVLAAEQAFVAFRSLDLERPQQFSRLSVAPLSADGEPGARRLAGPACERLAIRGGRGLCLEMSDGARFTARVLDEDMRPVRELRFAGSPSRVRVSPDGRWAGVTAFVQGHSYAQPGEFSTSATIVDLRSGKRVADLERDFTVTHDGRAVTSRDRNFWGLTFAEDGDTFYATLATRGSTYLIRGSLRDRTATTIHENVECPSLSPDGTRIGYKKAVGRAEGDHNPVLWRFHVLDLASGRETPLAEERSLDDQVEWLDGSTLLYRIGNATWAVPADGSGAAREWLPAADSAVVVRPG